MVERLNECQSLDIYRTIIHPEKRGRSKICEYENLKKVTWILKTSISGNSKFTKSRYLPDLHISQQLAAFIYIEE